MHKQSVHGGRNYTCGTCDYQTNTINILRIHQKSSHEERRVKCDQNSCNSSIAKHNQGVHEGIKYPCSVCDYKACICTNLNVHGNSINEDLKYEYNNCDYKTIGL